MPLILRIDVDKPYGNHTLFRKISSKFFEETAWPCPNLGYLDHLKNFLEILDNQNVVAIFYFRICTIPSLSMLKEIIAKGHKVAWHLENSSSYEAFLQELEAFKAKTSMTPHSFTKHGSGVKKLGRFHYPLYEEDKYRTWSLTSGIPFLFGNQAMNEKQDMHDGFYPSAFWIESSYRDPAFNKLEQAISKAKNNVVPILTHPENVIRDSECKKDLLHLIEMAKEAKIQWRLL